MNGSFQAVIFVAWLIGVIAATPAEAQVWLTKSWDEAITLDLDNAATKRLASVEDFAAERQWDVVAGLLRQAQAEQGDKLVPIAPGWYVSVTRYCQCRAALLPAPGLTAYRSLADGAAAAWLVDARKSDDRAAWLRIARRAFATSHGAEAVRRLAEQAFEVGDFAAARIWWELLLPAEPALRTAAGVGLLRQPNGSVSEAEIRATLILCSAFEGDVTRADQELSAFRRKHELARGRLGQRDGVLAELLSDELVRARGVNSSGDSQPPEIGRIAWSYRLPEPNWAGSVLTGSREPVAAHWPTVTNQKVFVTNGDEVFGWELADGRPAWSAAGNGGTVAGSERNVVAPDYDGAPNDEASLHVVANPLAPKLPIQGRVLQTVTVFEDRLYARLGTPITGRAKQESETASELIGLDIGTGEGKLVWRVAAEELDPNDPLRISSPWCFEGSPAANGQRVFAVMRRSLPQEEIQVGCFDADTGRLLWRRKIGVTIAATLETVNSTSHLCVTLADDSVFVSTDEGAVAALDQLDGSIRWLRTIAEGVANEVQPRRRFGHTPPQVHRGVMYVAPLNNRVLMAIHAESGLRLWQREWPDPIQFLLGITDDTLIVSGRSLWGVRLSDGLPSWPLRRVGDDDPEGWSAGRGVLLGRHIIWPMPDELLVVAAASGQIDRRIALRTSESSQPSTAIRGGDLFVAGDRLLMSRDRLITAWRLESGTAR